MAAIETFAETVRQEMDLRLEAAAASELAENFAGDPDFRVPEVDWPRTAQRVLTTARIDGVAVHDPAALAATCHPSDYGLGRPEEMSLLTCRQCGKKKQVLSADGTCDDLDDDVCTCCQTDMALTSTGPVAVYRDRSPEEVRDIYLARLAPAGSWTEPTPVHEDWRTT